MTMTASEAAAPSFCATHKAAPEIESKAAWEDWHHGSFVVFVVVVVLHDVSVEQFLFVVTENETCSNKYI